MCSLSFEKLVICEWKSSLFGLLLREGVAGPGPGGGGGPRPGAAGAALGGWPGFGGGCRLTGGGGFLRGALPGEDGAALADDLKKSIKIIHKMALTVLILSEGSDLRQLGSDAQYHTRNKRADFNHGFYRAIFRVNLYH